MIYFFLKRIIRLSLSVFFERIEVTGTEHLPAKGPLIVVANHPSTLMDPLLIASVMKQRIGFVGNASLFVNKAISSFFRYFHVIPIYRQKDVKPGEKPDNEKTFSACHAYLAKKGTLLIFPEGTSIHEMKLRKIKTGTARIALSFARSEKYQNPLTILSVALVYSDALRFRSRVSIMINPPVTADDYIQKGNDTWESVRALTGKIENDLARWVPHIEHDEDEKLVLAVQNFATAFRLSESDKLWDTEDIPLRKSISSAINNLRRSDPDQYNKLIEVTGKLKVSLEKNTLSPGLLSDEFLSKSGFKTLTGLLVFLVMGFPFFLVGLVSNYIPYILPSKIFDGMKIDIEYRTSVLFVSGMLLFPMYYFGMIYYIHHYFLPETFWIPLILLLMVLSGFFSLIYRRKAGRFNRILKFYTLPQSVKSKLIQHKNDFLNLINKLS